jgi:hypothetical protein
MLDLKCILISGKIRPFWVATSSKTHAKSAWRLIGKGKVYSVNGVLQDLDSQILQYFWRQS